MPFHCSQSLRHPIPPYTAMGLLASLGVMNLENGLDGILNENVRSSPAITAHVPVFTCTKSLSVNDLLAMQVSSEDRAHPT